LSYRHAVVTLAGPEENSMGRGGLDQSGRRRPYEASLDSPTDPEDGNGGWLGELLAPDEPLPENALAEADDSFEVELEEVDVEEFLASHALTDEQTALLALFLSGIGDPNTVWATLVDSLTDAFLSYVTEEDNSN
jgi:hypothetical protein